MISGQADGEELVLARRGEEVFAIGAHCTHYGGPLGEGLIVGETVRCPWHHACFSLRTGEALRAPALVGELKDWATRFLFVRKFHHRLQSAGRTVQARL
jgi:nitrite reductase/ring-hydroxylating ferredoxin subunit